MCMEMTWLQFQLSTDNQNGCQVANFFQLFFQNSIETWYIYRFLGSASLLVLFSCETENEAAADILVLSLLINLSYFQLIALKPGI